MANDGSSVDPGALDPDEMVNRELQHLNSTFYKFPPSDHLYARWLTLMTIASSWDTVADTIEGGLEYGSLKFGGVSVTRDVEEVQRFVAVETEVLLHHAIEALFRLILAHDRHPGSPWLSAAELVSFKEFEQRVTSITGDDAVLRRVIPQVIYGIDEERRAVAAGVPMDLYHAGVENLAAWLRYLGARLFNRTNRRAYNAAKHGFLAVSGKATFIIGDDPKTSIGEHGDAMTFLDVTIDRKTGIRSGSETIMWIDSELNLSTTHFIVQVMAEVCSINGFRLTGENQPKGLRFFEGPSLEQVLLAHTTKRKEKLAGASGLPFVSLEAFPRPLGLSWGPPESEE